MISIEPEKKVFNKHDGDIAERSPEKMHENKSPDTERSVSRPGDRNDVSRDRDYDSASAADALEKDGRKDDYTTWLQEKQGKERLSEAALRKKRL